MTPPVYALALAAGVAVLVTATVAGFVVRRTDQRWRLRHATALAAEREVRRILDELPEAVLVVDAQQRIRASNAWTTELIGRRDLQGVTARMLVLDDDRERFDECWDAVVSTGDPPPVLVRLPTPDGAAPLVVEAVFRRVEDDGGDAVDGIGPGHDRVLLRLRDVSERESQSAALEQARRRFQQAFHSAPTGMALVRLDDGRVVDANQSLAEMLGHTVADLVGRTLRELTHVDDVLEAVPHRARLELGIVDSYRVDQRFRRADGRYIWGRTRVSATEDDGVMLAITHVEDVTEQRRTAELLTRAARHDELTGLPNRSYLVQLLNERLGAAVPGSIAVLFIDLDQFKVVNDSLGHAHGDEVLVVTADRLASAVREDDVLARFGGDEFVVVLDGRHNDQPVEVHEVAERLRRACLAPIVVADHELYVTASIGYAVNTDAAATADDLMRDADAAMYRAKARGRDTVEAFEESQRETTTLALRTANELRRGLADGQIVPYFQPIVDLSTGRLAGHEVLARWLHPDRGLLAPDQFLAVAEEHGLLIELGAVMLRDSLAQLARWRVADPDAAGQSISVNIATRQLVDPDFYDVVAELLAETGIDAGSLWLEITETSLLADVKQVTVALRKLRSLGLHLAVDDFGTGYSSLTYLRRFPVEAIKIDRGFIGGLGLESDDTTIVEAVIRLGQSLGLVVVAEGVETPLQLSRLRELGCDRGQGYLFGRPRPAGLLERERVRS